MLMNDTGYLFRKRIMLSLTWFGNGTLKVTTDDTRFVFDPFITLNSELPKLQPRDIKERRYESTQGSHRAHTGGEGHCGQ